MITLMKLTQLMSVSISVPSMSTARGSPSEPSSTPLARAAMIQAFANRFNEAKDPFLEAEGIMEMDCIWRPAAMAQVSNKDPAPIGFHTLTFAGIGMSCKMIEPENLTVDSDWESLVSELSHWGNVPEPKSLNIMSLGEDERGPTAIIRGDHDWLAEFLPWGSDGLIRKRSTSSGTSADSPCGGYRWKETDVIIIRKLEQNEESAKLQLSGTMKLGDLSSTKEILRSCGIALGNFHSQVEAVRTTPPDPNRWNERLSSIEETLRADSIWRAQHSSDTECMLSIGDVRFCDITGDRVRIGRPRIADALTPPECQFPAIRDLASLVHDLSRTHYDLSSDFDIIELRSSLIGGWRETAPQKWCSDKVFYTHRGGLAIWEYEQCLLDVIESVSNQSGAPEPAVTLIRYVRPFQKRMFNNRTIGALSIMAGFFAISTLVSNFPPSVGEIKLPLLFLSASYLLMRFYRSLAPPPEVPFNRFFTLFG